MKGGLDASAAILLMGPEDRDAGNALFAVGGSRFQWGVKSNGLSSDGVLESTAVVNADTEYDIMLLFDGSRNRYVPIVRIMLHFVDSRNLRFFVDSHTSM